MSPADVLRKAADHLAKWGWVQNAAWKDGGGCCASAAVNTHSVLTCGHFGLARLAEEAFMAHTGQPFVRWNDTPGRTAEEVISTLRLVADKLEGAS